MKVLWVRGDSGPDVRKLRQALTLQLGSEAALYGALAEGDALDADTEAAVRRWQAGVGLIADGVVGPYGQQVLGLRKPGPMALALHPEWVRKLFPATKPANIARYLPYVAAALDAVCVSDQPMVCAALATVRAESEGFVPISEFQSQFNTAPGGAPFGLYEAAGNALGNTQPGDGARFRGRGFVQLTGRANYERCGAALGIALEDHADLANAPEVAAVLLAQFLAGQADAIRADLAAGRMARARQRVNGGTHGLDRFRDVFKIAAAAWTAPDSPAAAKATAASKKKAVAKRTLTVRKDPVDLNDRAYMPPPLGLQEVFPSDADMAEYLPRYTRAGLILNQGQEGACTGFGLAGVVNYLRWVQAGYPDTLPSVSPRMFYNFARRYDEYAGENYEGSSCRGALKGWFNHGVCLEDDWPYSDTRVLQPRFGYATRATRNTLGVYYRIDLKSITDMQAAIQAVGAIYVSAFTHKGWDAVPKTAAPPKGHADLPVIAFDGRPSQTDGHAFALVGFGARGFVIQNSWGTKFGAGGFAVLSYADWLANAMDAWVVAMGVPGVVAGRVSARSADTGRAAAAGVDTSAWWSEDQAYQHSVVLGNDGRTRRYLTEDELSRTLLHQGAGLPDQWFRLQGGNQPKRLVIYAHGGLNSEAAGITRARAMGRHFVGNGCYPVFMVWKTGLKESIADMLGDAFHTRPPAAGGIGEAISERTDLLVEKVIGRPLVRPIWSEMKENAALAFGNGRGGDLLITALQKLRDTWGNALEVHLVGHSAGSILLGHMLTALKARGLDSLVTSTHLFAPACTVQFANEHYAPLPEVMRALYLYVLSDRVERNDNVAAIYRKSLLYLVSNALEMDLRTPLLGLCNTTDLTYNGWDGASSTGETLKAWRRAAAEAGLNTADRYTVLSADRVKTAEPNIDIDANHGCFDNSIDVLRTTLMRIRRSKLLAAVDDLRGF